MNYYDRDRTFGYKVIFFCMVGMAVLTLILLIIE